MLLELIFGFEKIQRIKMNKRPRLQEALQMVKNLNNKDSQELLDDYFKLKESGQEYIAARLLVDTVELFYKIRNSKSAVNG